MRIVILSQDYPPAAYLIGRILAWKHDSVLAVFSSKWTPTSWTFPGKDLKQLVHMKVPGRVFIWRVVGQLVNVWHRRLSKGLSGAPYALSTLDLSRCALVPVHVCSDVDDPQTVERIAALTPDILMSIYFPMLIGTDLLTLPRIGALNIHPSLLPRHRGLYPSLQVLIQGDTLHGTTIHYMDKTFDTGEILEQRSFPVQPSDSYISLQEKSLLIGGDMLESVLERMDKGDLSSRAQPREGGSYGSWPTAKDLARFRRLGKRYGSPLRYWRMLDRLEKDLRCRVPFL